MQIRPLIRALALACLSAVCLIAAEHHGTVMFGGLPVPGATVTATQGDKKFVALSDDAGAYAFPDLADGAWTIEVEMLCFAPIHQDVTVAAGAAASQWDLKLLPMAEIQAAAGPQVPTVRLAESSPAAPAKSAANGKFQKADLNASKNAPPPPATPPSDSADTADLNQKASDGFLINGSSNNGAASPFALSQAFGNSRRGPRPLYNGSLGIILDNSTLDARSFSLTGQDTAKPAYNHMTGVATFGGPMRIPHLFRNGPTFFAGYQWTRNRNANTVPGLMPTAAERAGDFSQVILDPSTGAPFPGNMIPPNRLSPQARALLNLYPLPNFDSARYNYQIPIVSVSHQDNLQTRINAPVNRKNQLSGSFAFQSVRADNPNLFGFLDTARTQGINAAASWRHSLTPRLFLTLGYTFSRLSQRSTPYFENRQNISGQAGINGNNQAPLNWGPPSLIFSSGISGLSDAQQAFNRSQTGAVSYAMTWIKSPHTFAAGVDYRRQEFNYLSQQDPRGTFTFTGAATGSALADFLLGVPDASSIAYGNADKYFRAASYDAFLNDDWRVSPELTLNVGIRWEYGAPITELYGRLVNLDLTPGFTAEAPVVATQPTGSLTGQNYPSSLLRPDKHGFEPRVGLAWRPLAGSSMVIRAGYGVTYNTSVYQSIASQMAQQSPLSKSLSVANGPADPLTLANGFNVSPGITTNTFAVDPNFQVGYAQNWQVSVQRDLPAALIMTTTYLGTKGTRGMQEFLPNTYPSGAVNPCPSCPSGFVYLASNGNSTREAGQFQLRRRLHNGFTATLQYTYAKAIDDSALGGKGQGTPFIAQNWLDLSAERALSSFDQRHLLNATIQYTTGMGVSGGTLVSGWRGALFKEWTVSTQITAGTGLPLTPTYLAATQGTGITGTIRPEYTGAPLYAAPPGLFLNPAAFTAPLAGQWGNAGRDSITGPSQFTLNASLGRTFRVNDRMNLDLRLDSLNALNHVTYTSWITTENSAQFGLPVAANAMRSVQTTLRFRF